MLFFSDRLSLKHVGQQLSGFVAGPLSLPLWRELSARSLCVHCALLEFPLDFCFHLKILLFNSPVQPIYINYKTNIWPWFFPIVPCYLFFFPRIFCFFGKAGFFPLRKLFLFLLSCPLPHPPCFGFLLWEIMKLDINLSLPFTSLTCIMWLEILSFYFQINTFNTPSTFFCVSHMFLLVPSPDFVC